MMKALIQFSNFIHRSFENSILKTDIYVKKTRYCIWQKTSVIIITSMLIVITSILIYSIVDLFTNNSNFLLFRSFLTSITISLSIALSLFFLKEFIYELFPKYRDKIRKNPKKEKLLEKLNSIPKIPKKSIPKTVNMKTNDQHKLQEDYIKTFFYYELDESIKSFKEELKELNPFQRLFTLIKMKYGYAIYQWENQLKFHNFSLVDLDSPILHQSEENIQDYNLILNHKKINAEIELELLSIYRNIFSDQLVNGLDLKNSELVQYSLFLYNFEDWKNTILNELSKLKLTNIDSQLKSVKSKIQDLKYRLDYPSVFFIEAMSGKVIPELGNESFTQIDEYINWLDSISISEIQDHSKNNQKIQINSKGSQKELIKLFDAFFDLIGVQLSTTQKTSLDIFIHHIIYSNGKTSKLDTNIIMNKNLKIDFIPKEKAYDFTKIFLFLMDKGYIESNKTTILEIISSNLQRKGVNNGFSLSNLKRIKKNEHDQFSVNGLKRVINSSILYNF